jgi:hypothetical protein
MSVLAIAWLLIKIVLAAALVMVVLAVLVFVGFSIVIIWDAIRGRPARILDWAVLSNRKFISQHEPRCPAAET